MAAAGEEAQHFEGAQGEGAEAAFDRDAFHAEQAAGGGAVAVAAGFYGAAAVNAAVQFGEEAGYG